MLEVSHWIQKETSESNTSCVINITRVPAYGEKADALCLATNLNKCCHCSSTACKVSLKGFTDRKELTEFICHMISVVGKVFGINGKHEKEQYGL